MKCPYCGFENPERSSFCNSCGKELSAPTSGGAGWPRRNCVACGRTIPDEANVCPYCGHDYRYQSALTQPREAVSSGMKILFYILSFLIPLAGFIIGAIYYSRSDPDSKHVGKICLILAIVGVLITVGLAALLYVMVLGFSESPIRSPAVTLSKLTVAHGVQLTFVSISQDVPWSDITIMLDDEYTVADWSPSTTHLTQGSPAATERFVSVSFGGLQVFCNVTDLGGNGRIDGGDYFTLTTGSANSFSTSTTYTVTIMYEPTAEAMCTSVFTG